MASSAAGSTNGDAGDGTDERPVTLERTVERLDRGIVVTYELTAEADEPVALDLTQGLPPELAVADVGFRTDAAPAEWTVEEDTVHGSGTVSGGEETVEYVLGLKLPEAPDRVPEFPETELVVSDGAAADTGATDGDTALAAPSDVDLDPETEDGTGRDTEDAPEGPADDGPALVGNTDSALAASVRQVIGSSSPDAADGLGDEVADESDAPAAAATDGGPEATDPPAGADDAPTPRENPGDAGSGLEAAVAAVESELDEEEPSFPTTDDTEEAEQHELDLSVPEVEAADETPDGETDGAAKTGAPADLDVDALADRLAAADEAERRAVRDALGVDDGTDDHAGTVTVRLENLESRLSAFEAYEDALAAFIEETGTVERVEATATEAAEAADELRTEVADLREEVTAAREAVEVANEERAALRDEMDTLRDEVSDALGLRQQLLGALQNAGDTTEAEDAPAAE